MIPQAMAKTEQLVVIKLTPTQQGCCFNKRKEELTSEDIQRKYNAAMDSVNLLEKGKPKTVSDEDWADTVQRNTGHLKTMLEKDIWDGYDLEPFKVWADNAL